jgi:hypothetical protein
MNNMKIATTEVSIDGQSIIVPTVESWRILMENPFYDDIPVYLPHTKRMIDNLVNFISSYQEDFCLGIYRAKHLKRSWHVVPLFKVNDSLQRVHIEYPTCSNCHWRGAIANPSEPSLYLGIPDKLNATRRANSFSPLGCPRCGVLLPRFAIWTESSFGEKKE